MDWNKIENELNKIEDSCIEDEGLPTHSEYIFDEEKFKEKVKNFFQEKIIQILDECIGEEALASFNIENRDIDGYNQKRKELIEYKQQFIKKD